MVAKKRFHHSKRHHGMRSERNSDRRGNYSEGMRYDEERGRGDFSERGEYSSQPYGNEHEPYGMPEGDVNHRPDKFNDEWRSDRDVYPRGMFRRPLSNGELYAGMPTRMRTELEDGQMIREDHRAIANLPQEVMIKAYPRTGPYMPEDLEDSIIGVDAQMDYDDSQRRNHFYPKKV